MQKADSEKERSGSEELKDGTYESFLKAKTGIQIVISTAKATFAKM